MGQFIAVYFVIAAGVLGTWLMACWCEERELNLFVALLCSVGWGAALVYVTARYAMPWLALRLYRDARAVLVRPVSRAQLGPEEMRSPRDAGIYD